MRLTFLTYCVCCLKCRESDFIIIFGASYKKIFHEKGLYQINYLTLQGFSGRNPKSQEKR